MTNIQAATKIRNDHLLTQPKTDSTISFNNKSKSKRILTVYSLNPEGKFIKINEIQTWKPKEETTFLGQSWMIKSQSSTNNEKEIIAVFVLPVDVSRFRVTLKPKIQ